MSIAYAGANSVTSGSTTETSYSISYSPTAGNFIWLVITVGGTSTISSVQDNNSNSLTAGPSNSSRIYTFYGTAQSGATSYTVSLGTARSITIGIVEYSGVVGTGASSNGNANNQTSAALAITTTKTNSWLLTAFGVGSQQVFTAVIGTIRVQRPGGSGSSNSQCSADNVGTTSGSSLNCEVSFSSSANYWAACLEVYPVQTTGIPNSLMLTGCGM